MATAVEEVERYLEFDIALHDALARGFLNVRRAARWLIDTHGWDMTEEAVVSALRRYQSPRRADFETARHLLAGADFTARTGFAIFRFQYVPECLKARRRLVEALPIDETLAIVPERDVLTVLVDDRNAQRVLDLFLPMRPVAEFRRITRIELLLPEPDPTAAMTLALVLHLLAHRNIQVYGIHGALPNVSILVPDSQAQLAHRTVLWLTKSRESERTA